jgi:hypothetical protein
MLEPEIHFAVAHCLLLLLGDARKWRSERGEEPLWKRSACEDA